MCRININSVLEKVYSFLQKIPMVLYAANVEDLAKKVESEAPKKSKKAKKVPLTPPNTPAVEKAPEPEVKEKKVVSEKKLEAIKKAQLTRKRKREEAALAKQKEDEEIAAKQKEIAEKEAEIERKKNEAKEKRKLAREKRKADQIEKPDEPKQVTKKQKPKIDDKEPPTWFKQYIEGVKKEQSHISKEKKPAKQIQQEAEEEAHVKWQDGLTRDRVRNEMDRNFSRMYSMIFGQRRL